MGTYVDFIQNILNTRGRFEIKDGSYKERHHIIPKCIGGNNNEDNLIDLYAKEHFEAHRLLAQENPNDIGLVTAWYLMSHVSNEYTERYICTPEEYEEARQAYAKIMQDIMSGDRNPMYGRPWWDENTSKDKIDEWKNHMSNALKEKWSDIEFKEKMCSLRKGMNMGETNPMWGKEVSEETRRKLSESSLKRWENDDYRIKMLDHLQGENNPFYGKHHTEVTKEIIKEKIKQKHISGAYKCCMKKVVQLTLGGDFINYFDSIKEVSILTGVNYKSISACCNKKYKHSGGFTWMFAEEYSNMINNNEWSIKDAI